MVTMPNLNASCFRVTSSLVTLGFDKNDLFLLLPPLVKHAKVFAQASVLQSVAVQAVDWQSR